jgi:anti-sigma-K factor RskA
VSPQPPPQRDGSADDAHVHLLTGAYATGALAGPERELFERHLADCPSCTQEVRELRATTARLAEAVAEPPSPAMRAAVLQAIGTVRQDPPTVDELARKRVRRSWPSRMLGVAAALLLLVSVSLASLSVTLERRLDRAEAENRVVTEVLAAPDATARPARRGGEGSAIVVMTPSTGRAVFVAGGLPGIRSDQAYQLWVLRPGTTPIPDALLSVHDGRATGLLRGDMRGASGVALTLEPAGGSPKPSGDPVVVIDVA